jgi:hypothetical protein
MSLQPEVYESMRVPKLSLFKHWTRAERHCNTCIHLKSILKPLSLNIGPVQLEPLLSSVHLYLGLRRNKDNHSPPDLERILSALGRNLTTAARNDTQTRALDRSVSLGCIASAELDLKNRKLVDRWIVELCLWSELCRLLELGMGWGRGVGEHGDEGVDVSEFWGETCSDDVVYGGVSGGRREGIETYLM